MTGGGRGIGRGICRALAKAGANVVIAGRTPGPLQETAEEVRNLGAQSLVVPVDICSQAEIDRLVDLSIKEFGYIDGWVNNAGSASASDVGRLLDIKEDQWDRVVDLNLKWTFFAAQAAARSMTKGGSIINITSRTASQPCPMTGQYGAAKAGVESLTGTMAVEWGHRKIRVNAIAPGVVLTENSTSMEKSSTRRRQIETVPLRRLGEVDDVGPLAVYFVADESSWVTGTVVPVAGGSRIPIGTLSYLHHINREMEELEAASLPSQVTK
ncbi:3-oxoacyl-ACP reductase [Hyphomonas polymorpha PS728]|uniref:3-oxoacyl-ACP reductase n=1 Tax=Hyphomonas polymorpha PS728 TaxID=1280954 RepID=A0A062V940_9PROT|nr:3-oxoacyl-ACP reductase [Hyphomonas polymorpha PS728]